MKSFASYRKYASAIVLATALLLTDNWWGGHFIGAGSFVSSAEARVGRPRTPRSVAGVARRTTRRTIRRSAVYLSTLPGGCGTVVVNGMRLTRCGGVYYQPYGGRYVVVYVN